MEGPKQIPKKPNYKRTFSKKENKEPKAYSQEELNAALQITHSEYFMQVVALLSYDKNLEDLNYIRVPLTTPDGGTYLVSILHVDGPKINLQKLAKSAEYTESQNKKES